MPVHLINKSFAREVEDMSNLLFLSGYCIFGYAIGMITYLGLQTSKQFPFFAWSAAVACLNGAGILQVCAIQRVIPTQKIKVDDGDPARTLIEDEKIEFQSERQVLLTTSTKDGPKVKNITFA